MRRRRGQKMLPHNRGRLYRAEQVIRRIGGTLDDLSLTDDEAMARRLDEIEFSIRRVLWTAVTLLVAGIAAFGAAVWLTAWLVMW